MGEGLFEHRPRLRVVAAAVDHQQAALPAGMRELDRGLDRLACPFLRQPVEVEPEIDFDLPALELAKPAPVAAFRQPLDMLPQPLDLETPAKLPGPRCGFSGRRAQHLARPLIERLDPCHGAPEESVIVHQAIVAGAGELLDDPMPLPVSR